MYSLTRLCPERCCARCAFWLRTRPEESGEPWSAELTGRHSTPRSSAAPKGSAAFVKVAAIVTFRHIGPTILLLLIQALVAVGIFFMPWGILIFPGVGIFASTYPMEKVLKTYTPAVSEDDPEAQKWYYQ